MTTRRCYNCMKELGEAVKICPVCGYDNSSPAQPAQALSCGTVLHDRYLVGKMLGQGGFGITYIGYDYTLDTTVCIKEFFPAGGAMRGNDGSGRVYWSAGTTGAARQQDRETFVKEVSSISGTPSTRRMRVKRYTRISADWSSSILRRSSVGRITSKSTRVELG